MPLTRYQIRNECSLADPELYKAADRDDPEALLEGVAMAGLVGVLRQLGDLAEFAAEIFHDLHEEVMVTAARGHGLMVRVQQLEAEFPSIEKAFLSQTDHSLFFSNAGVDWHPNLQMEQNLVTRGDLPRCVMDSYEECRGPPQLFLLDKFDVAGAGACLKRYTDPSFFKVEAPSEIPLVEIQREKKIRKVKKKGSRWRNGETPEIVPAAHAKLHQLFSEESTDKGRSDPARLVKLKKRQLNASPFDSRSGKSYMEKFLETAPEHNVVRDISVASLHFNRTSDNSSESGLEIHDIITVSPVKKSSRGNESACTSPDAHEVLLKPSIDELYGEVIDRQIVKVPEPSVDGQTDGIPTGLHKMTIEKEIVVDEEGKPDSSVDGDNSDGITSEVDNYMDALTTMESEMDNEYRPKTGPGFSNVEKLVMDSDKNGEQLELQAHSWDSQAIGNLPASDDGNSSFNKGRSSFSYSDTLGNLAENTPSDGGGLAKVFPSSEAEITETTSNQLPADVGLLRNKSHELVLPNDMSIDEDNTCDLVEASTNSSLIDLNPPLLALDTGESSLQEKLDGTPSETMKPCSELSYMDERDTNLGDSWAVASDMPSKTRDGTLFTVCPESRPVDKLDGGDPNYSSDHLLHLSANSELAPEKKSSYDSLKGLQTDFAEENCPENMVDIKIGSLHSTASPRKEKVHCSSLPEVEVYSGFTMLSDSSDVGKSADVVSKVDAFLENSTFIVDTSQNSSFKEQQVSDIVDNVPQVEVDFAENVALYLEEANLADISGHADGEKMGASSFKVEAMEGDAVPLELPCSCSDSSILEDHLNFDDVVAEGVQSENMKVFTTATNNVPAEDCVDDGIDTVVHPPPDIICSPSKETVILQESPSGTEDPHKDGLESNELVSPECLRGSEAKNELTQLEVVSKDFDSASSNFVSYDESNLEMVRGVHSSSLAGTNKNSLTAGDVTMPPASSELANQEMESKRIQSHLLEDGEDGTSSPAAHLADRDTSLGQLLELQSDQLDVEFVRVEASLDSPSHLSEEMQSSNNTNQERLFTNASESCQEDLPSQPSPSGLLQPSTGLEINNTKPEIDPLGSVLPSFGLLLEATQVNIEEMPPLPPLPPMQWRLGKTRHTPLFSQSEMIDHRQESFPSIFPFGDHKKAQSGFPSQQRGMLQHVNPFLSVSAVEDEKLQYASEREVGNEMQPTLSSLQLPSMANDANSQKNGLALEGTQSLNPFLTLSALPSETPECGFIASEHEEVQSSSNPFLSLPAVGDTTYKHDPRSSPEKLIHTLYELEPEPGLEGKTLQGTPENSEGERGNPSDTSALPPGKVEQKPRHSLLSSEGKTLKVAPENSEEERGNPSDTSALPPRKVEEQHQYSLLSSEGKTVQIIPENSEEECGNPSDTSALPPDKVEEQPQHSLLSLEGKTLQSIPENSEGEHGNPSDTHVLPPGKVEEQPLHGLPSSEGESVWSSNPFAMLPTSEVGKANGSSVVKLPRPRNPLIDAVAALDKSKLRKVTERVRPQSGPKVDERDSLLEQIRTKSFNLKPATVSRPTIHGPQTNLKVAAILEKANAIRQATAGSDEDDNEEWSDS